MQPLKLNIHQDLYAALPAGLSSRQVQRFLWWYVNRPVYQKALLHGKGRIDLTGAVVDSEIPAAIREQARERWQQMRNAKSTHPAGTPRSAKPIPRAAPAPVPTLNLKELYAMAVDAKLEITLKFSTLPQAKSAGQGKMAFALKIPDGQFVTAEISNKVWNKLVKTNTDWLQWVAALAGTMGPRTEQGFQLNNPGLQVFERTPKAPAEAVPSPADTAPAPASPLAASAPVEPASRPPAAAPIPPTSPTSKPVLSLKTRKITP